MLRPRTFLFASILLIASCGGQSTNSTTPTENATAVNVDAIPGIYSAIMPCEGCQSRRMLITLRPNHSATQTDIWITNGKPESSISNGVWQWNEQTKLIEVRNESNVKLDLEFQSDSALLMSESNDPKSIVFRKQKSILNSNSDEVPLSSEQQQQQLRELSKDVHEKASDNPSTSGNH